MFDEIIQQASEDYVVPESWIRAVIQTESNWDASAHNESDPYGGAWGLMQLLYPTAKALGYSGEPEGLLDPGINIPLGTQLLQDLIRRYGLDFRRVYSAYNSGNPDRWETSSQVAANVNRALSNLAQWATENPATGGGLLAGLLVLGLFLIRRR